MVMVMKMNFLTVQFPRPQASSPRPRVTPEQVNCVAQSLLK